MSGWESGDIVARFLGAEGKMVKTSFADLVVVVCHGDGEIWR
jgi:hypothetical protein